MTTEKELRSFCGRKTVMNNCLGKLEAEGRILRTPKHDRKYGEYCLAYRNRCCIGYLVLNPERIKKIIDYDPVFVIIDGLEHGSYFHSKSDKVAGLDAVLG